MTKIQLGSNSRAKRSKLGSLTGTTVSFQSHLPTPNTAKRVCRLGVVDDELSHQVATNNNDGSRARRSSFQLLTDWLTDRPTDRLAD